MKKPSCRQITVFALAGIFFLAACTVQSKKIKPVPAGEVFAFLEQQRLSRENVFFPAEEGNYFVLPQLRLADGKGNVYLHVTGYRKNIASEIEKAAEKRKPIGRLTDFLLLDANGKQTVLSDLPRAELYILEDWASWCKPCPYLMREIEEFLSRQPTGRFVAIKICHDIIADSPPRPPPQRLP